MATTLDLKSLSPLKWVPAGLRDAFARRTRTTLDVLSASATELMPKGLYARAMIIIIAPIFFLGILITFVFLERHW
ncbi:hypothetical protein ABTK10_21335, partial [Acinetobacter baumannii]